MANMKALWVSADLHRRIRFQALEEGIPMTQWVEGKLQATLNLIDEDEEEKE